MPKFFTVLIMNGPAHLQPELEVDGDGNEHRPRRMDVEIPVRYTRTSAPRNVDFRKDFKGFGKTMRRQPRRRRPPVPVIESQ